MEFDLTGRIILSGDASNAIKDIQKFIANANEELLKKGGIDGGSKIEKWRIDGDKIFLHIKSGRKVRAHEGLLRIKKAMGKLLGEKYHIGIREIKIDDYLINFEIDREPIKKIEIPFASLSIDGKKVTMHLANIDEEFLMKNYVDRMINLVNEKVNAQYYEGKEEFWELIWRSEKKEPIWKKDPSEEMAKLGWIKHGPTKGKWFYRSPATAIMRGMEEIALNEVLKPLGFEEIIEPVHVPFELWLKTGHLEGIPGEVYYVSEPLTRDVEKWEDLIDLVKIKKEVPINLLEKKLSRPKAGMCYAQCPIIYWSFMGKTIADKSLPILVFDKTAISNRYESGGRHGIERTDEFHRIEPVYIGKKEQIMEIKEKLLERYKRVFEEIMELEWRMAWVTPFYMQQAGEIVKEKGEGKEKGTIDFEAWLPYRGDRENSKWLELHNLSIMGNRYTKAFNIKGQKREKELWSGCSGIGLERWTAAFLAQKGMDPSKWPDAFKKYLPRLPKITKFM